MPPRRGGPSRGAPRKVGEGLVLEAEDVLLPGLSPRTYAQRLEEFQLMNQIGTHRGTQQEPIVLLPRPPVEPDYRDGVPSGGGTGALGDLASMRRVDSIVSANGDEYPVDWDKSQQQQQQQQQQQMHRGQLNSNPAHRIARGESLVAVHTIGRMRRSFTQQQPQQHQPLESATSATFESSTLAGAAGSTPTPIANDTLRRRSFFAGGSGPAAEFGDDPAAMSTSPPLLRNRNASLRRGTIAGASGTSSSSMSGTSIEHQLFKSAPPAVLAKLSTFVNNRNGDGGSWQRLGELLDAHRRATQIASDAKNDVRTLRRAGEFYPQHLVKKAQEEAAASGAPSPQQKLSAATAGASSPRKSGGGGSSTESGKLRLSGEPQAATTASTTVTDLTGGPFGAQVTIPQSVGRLPTTSSEMTSEWQDSIAVAVSLLSTLLGLLANTAPALGGMCDAVRRVLFAATYVNGRNLSHAFPLPPSVEQCVADVDLSSVKKKMELFSVDPFAVIATETEIRRLQHGGEEPQALLFSVKNERHLRRRFEVVTNFMRHNMIMWRHVTIGCVFRAWRSYRSKRVSEEAQAKLVTELRAELEYTQTSRKNQQAELLKLMADRQHIEEASQSERTQLSTNHERLRGSLEHQVNNLQQLVQSNKTRYTAELERLLDEKRKTDDTNTQLEQQVLKLVEHISVKEGQVAALEQRVQYLSRQLVNVGKQISAVSSQLSSSVYEHRVLVARIAAVTTGASSIPPLASWVTELAQAAVAEEDILFALTVAVNSGAAREGGFLLSVADLQHISVRQNMVRVRDFSEGPTVLDAYAALLYSLDRTVVTPDHVAAIITETDVYQKAELLLEHMNEIFTKGTRLRTVGNVLRNPATFLSAADLVFSTSSIRTHIVLTSALMATWLSGMSTVSLVEPTVVDDVPLTKPIPIEEALHHGEDPVTLCSSRWGAVRESFTLWRNALLAMPSLMVDYLSETLVPSAMASSFGHHRSSSVSSAVMLQVPPISVSASSSTSQPVVGLRDRETTSGQPPPHVTRSGSVSVNFIGEPAPRGNSANSNNQQHSVVVGSSSGGAPGMSPTVSTGPALLSAFASQRRQSTLIRTSSKTLEERLILASPLSKIFLAEAVRSIQQLTLPPAAGSAGGGGGRRRETAAPGGAGGTLLLTSAIAAAIAPSATESTPPLEGNGSEGNAAAAVDSFSSTVVSLTRRFEEDASRLVGVFRYYAVATSDISVHYPILVLGVPQLVDLCQDIGVLAPPATASSSSPGPSLLAGGSNNGDGETPPRGGASKPATNDVASHGTSAHPAKVTAVPTPPISNPVASAAVSPSALLSDHGFVTLDDIREMVFSVSKKRSVAAAAASAALGIGPGGAPAMGRSGSIAGGGGNVVSVATGGSKRNEEELRSAIQLDEFPAILVRLACKVGNLGTAKAGMSPSLSSTPHKRGVPGEMSGTTPPLTDLPSSSAEAAGGSGSAGVTPTLDSTPSSSSAALLASVMARIREAVSLFLGQTLFPRAMCVNVGEVRVVMEMPAIAALLEEYKPMAENLFQYAALLPESEKNHGKRHEKKGGGVASAARAALEGGRPQVAQAQFVRLCRELHDRGNAATNPLSHATTAAAALQQNNSAVGAQHPLASPPTASAPSTSTDAAASSSAAATDVVYPPPLADSTFVKIFAQSQPADLQKPLMMSFADFQTALVALALRAHPSPFSVPLPKCTAYLTRVCEPVFKRHFPNLAPRAVAPPPPLLLSSTAFRSSSFDFASTDARLGDGGGAGSSKGTSSELTSSGEAKQNSAGSTGMHPDPAALSSFDTLQPLPVAGGGGPAAA